MNKQNKVIDNKQKITKYKNILRYGTV